MQRQNKKYVYVKLKETVQNVIRNLNDDYIYNSSGLSIFILMGALVQEGDNKWRTKEKTKKKKKTQKEEKEEGGDVYAVINAKRGR